MKKLRLGLPILAFVLAVATSAFTVDTALQVDPVYKLWVLEDLANPDDPSSYTEITDPQEYNEIICSGSATVCKMEAQDDGTGHPQFVDQNNDGLPDEDGTLVKQRFLRSSQ